MAFKKTCNAADVARMKKLVGAGNTVEQISMGMRIEVACVRRNLAGMEVRKAVTDAPETEVVGTDAPEAPALTPAQKGAQTKARKKAEAAQKVADAKATPVAEEAGTEPSFVD